MQDGLGAGDCFPALERSSGMSFAEKRKKNRENHAAISQMAAENGYTVSSGQLMLDYYYELPIDEKMILIVSLGNRIKGSMLYVLQELHTERFKDYQVYLYVTEDTKKESEKIIADNNFYNLRTVGDGPLYNQVLASAKYLITEVRLPAHWIKKEGQIYINIWHGTPLKCLGLDKNTKNLHKDGKTQRNFIDADYLLFPNDHTREHMLDAYRIRNLTHAKALMCGYPRSSILLDQETSARLHERLAPDGEQVIAYMPTWRDERPVNELIEEMQFMLDSVDKNLTEHQILYVNLHHKIGDSLDYSHFRHILKFPADMDNYEVLAGTDVLFTDYSSVFFDFLVSGRKIILYCPDIDEYFRTRGTYIDLKAMPFEKAYNNAQLIREILQPKRYDDSEVFKEFCAYDSVDNVRNVCSIFADDTDDLNILPITGNGKKNVVIFSEQLQKSDSTALLKQYTNIRSGKHYNLYISCKDTKVDSNKASAYPMIAETDVIGIPDGILMTSAQKCAKKMFEEGKLDFDSYIGFTEDAYDLENRRVYGASRFDIAVLYETDDPERILAYAQMQTKKMFFIQESMAEAMENGDDFMKKACCYMADRCSGIYVISEKMKQKVEKLLGSRYAGMTVVLKSAGEFDRLITEQCR